MNDCYVYAQFLNSMLHFCQKSASLFSCLHEQQTFCKHVLCAAMNYALMNIFNIYDLKRTSDNNDKV
ncbi:hypothetical protein BpHYR1_036429 [Brachionus plicatilis]|uniref:Uncharacterized protein n=1 Tax=Brachionus plicatilis TaxID=10195 RepID=A0A3M7QCA3_BRAPC|nr:hypothetical protein BpHYR1_036429 [Brachionus plicatilis]